MIKIISLGKNVRAYLKLYGNKRPKLSLTCENEKCNCCVLHGHGRYFRSPVFKHKQYWLPIYRWCCPNCNQTVSVLPDFLTPWGHFAIPVREAALKRKQQGKSYPRVAETVISAKTGSISTQTIKRWWKCHLHKAGDVCQWIAGELIRVGFKEDLLRLHSQGVNPTPVDTVCWLTTLAQKYLHTLGFNPTPLAGYFGFLNTRLPVEKRV
ncbi:DUF6431 domain-containing protein [Peptococcaceae bacterium]|jgi:hypothetical protein|nr:DUF6431 domain-containing protein [Peptococcaceae bacterium]